jgi:hypothetical protein
MVLAMAGKGFPPRGYQSRDRDQARRQPQTNVPIPTENEIYGKPITELAPDAPWHPQTVAWWETWRHSPMAKTWLETDWDFLLDTAILHTQFWSRPNFNGAAELRQRVAKLGATIEDRQRLKISITTDNLGDDKPSPGIAAIDDYRAKLSS